MDFSDPNIIYLTEQKNNIIPGICCTDLSADYINPYKYATQKTLQYLQQKLHLQKSTNLIEDLIKINTNTNPLKVTTVHNLLHCGLIYKLDLGIFISDTMTVEHFTNLRLILYLVSLMPIFGKPKSNIKTVIHKIAPDYLKYLLYEYHLTGIDPLILTDSEVYETFEKLEVPPKYEIYNCRYRRLYQLHNLRSDIFQILCKKLYNCTDLVNIVTKTVQSNLEYILLNAKDYEELIQKLGMNPLKMHEYNFDADEYILHNFIDYIHYTDKGETDINDLYTAIEKGVIIPFLNKYTDYDLIYNITGIFVSYNSRAELISKLNLICGTIPKFFIKLGDTLGSESICYGNIHSYNQYSASELKKNFENYVGFMNTDGTQFSITVINELCETGIYFKQFIPLINFCKEKIKKIKNKN